MPIRHHHYPDSTSITTGRNGQIAAIHAEHAGQVERRVARRAYAGPQTIEDACSFAWMHLITHDSIDLDTPNRRVVAWVTQTAVHEVWRLEAKRARGELLDNVALERKRRLREQTGPGADELAAQHARFDLVAQVPERPRRFLLRLALGHSYREIAADENVSVTTTNKQIARTKRLLRALDETDTTRRPGSPAPRSADAARTVGVVEHSAAT